MENFQRDFFGKRVITLGNLNQLIFSSHNKHFMSGVYLRKIIKNVLRKQLTSYQYP